MGVRSWAEYERDLLLGGAWLPVTGCVLFLNASADWCADTLLNGGRGRHVMEYYGHPLRVRPVRAGSLAGMLGTLLPLDSPEHRRNLLVPTVNPEWTAMFTSDWRGQEPGSPIAWFAVGGIASISVKDVPNSYDSTTGRGFRGVRRIGLCELRLHGQAIRHFLGVQATYTSHWEFLRPRGEFPGGNVWNPTAKRIPDRFTHEHLAEMARRFGLRPFDEDFYAPDGGGLMVERTGPLQSDQKTFTLAQSRGEELIDW